MYEAENWEELTPSESGGIVVREFRARNDGANISELETLAMHIKIPTGSRAMKVENGALIVWWYQREVGDSGVKGETDGYNRICNGGRAAKKYAKGLALNRDANQLSAN